MLLIPSFARPLLDEFAPVFFHPTYQRFLVLLVAASSPPGDAPSPTCSAPSPAGPRRSLQLSPRLLEATLVGAPLGAAPGQIHPRPLRPRRPRLPGGRRYRRRAPRRQGPRQGLSSRSGALDPLLHRLSLGAQMGRLVDPGQVPLRRPALGAAGPGGAVSQPGEGPRPKATAAKRRGKKAKDDQGPRPTAQSRKAEATPAAKPWPQTSNGRRRGTRPPRN